MEKRYLFECWYCGEYVPKIVAKPHNRVFHEECEEKFLKEKEDTKQEYVRLKVEVMYERALRMLEKQNRLSLSEYKEAAEAVHGLAKKQPSKFASSHEMVAAMELIRNEVRTRVQHPVGRRKVDMVLPEFKVALEIDGGLHKFRIGKDSARDIEILNTLNENEVGWEMVRIPTKFIETNIKGLIPAIKTLHKEKQDLRRKNNGFIPSYYSRHNASAQLQALEKVDDDTKEQFALRDPQE